MRQEDALSPSQQPCSMCLQQSIPARCMPNTLLAHNVTNQGERLTSGCDLTSSRKRLKGAIAASSQRAMLAQKTASMCGCSCSITTRQHQCGQNAGSHKTWCLSMFQPACYPM